MLFPLCLSRIEKKREEVEGRREKDVEERSRGKK